MPMRLLLTLIGIGFWLASPAAAGTGVNNGLAPPNPANIIDYADTNLNVADLGCTLFPCGGDGTATTVAVVTGASISGDTLVFENSHIEMSGGSLASVQMYRADPAQTSSFLMQGGTITSLWGTSARVEGGTIGTLTTWDSVMTGGTITGSATALSVTSHESGIEMTGGQVIGTFIAAGGFSEIGGTASVGGISAPDLGGGVHVSGSATVGDVLIADGRIVTTGGSVGRVEITGDDGRADFWGGLIAGPVLPGPPEAFGGPAFFGEPTPVDSPVHDFEVDGSPVSMTYFEFVDAFVGGYISTGAGTVEVTGTFDSGEAFAIDAEFTQAGQELGFVQLVEPAVPVPAFGGSATALLTAALMASAVRVLRQIA